ncbi:hypothetical protein EJ08DRAFT_102351 [Tothia fuscella]|uniref:Fe2OG dioxygenase domain-containing protein n=1 Tax=Tothia fuscella TaxID=1048955 RepID=A0A9P4NXD6_9PEZI|nr:hypothetical protein EJ08DRAFT_102351 [Tothia fuscella]
MAETPITNPKKRKTLHDFFPPDQSKRGPKVLKDALGALTNTCISGLTIITNFMSSVEESIALEFLSRQPWRTDLARRVIHYGGTYCLMPPRTATPAERKMIESNILAADPIPSQLTFLLDKMVAQELYDTDRRPGYCIVNEYTETQGISAHVENFRFGEPVCALTMGDGDFMRFHELVKSDDGSVRSGKAAKAERTGRKRDVWLPPRSLLVMRGDARRKWQHEIVRGKKGRQEGWKRTSLTFRVEK